MFVPMRTQRIRDPIHDLIVFDDDGRVDGFAWELLSTPDVQRLRRIKQLVPRVIAFEGTF